MTPLSWALLYSHTRAFPQTFCGLLERVASLYSLGRYVGQAGTGHTLSPVFIWLQIRTFFETISGTTEQHFPALRHVLRSASLLGKVSSVRSATRG
jgi:hypothetical protein